MRPYTTWCSPTSSPARWCAWRIRTSAARLALGGIAILSGLLRHQQRYVAAAYLARGFRIQRRYHRDAWATLVLARR